ncbi:universal stress protein [Siculibacillus lacustris]|uniref:Universal stress protein n=1 Tax=Siculibacillus lacustris TaxID=1549641 RepID=A0A4Q9VLV8_9HYPH|nr:universal stress protein [Siculibacillus lacustris]TBW36411.1 universal stress protein [Siculibacillus lacustris]
MAMRRKALEAGHRRKFLVVVDDTPECDRAVVFATLRASHTDGGLVLLYVVDDSDFRGFLGVEQTMRAEARAEAETVLEAVAARVQEIAAVTPERVLREGERAAAVLALIEADEDVAVLVLAAGTDSDGPGPLVASLAGRASGHFPIPITIVPGHLSDAEIAAVA